MPFVGPRYKKREATASESKVIAYHDPRGPEKQSVSNKMSQSTVSGGLVAFPVSNYDLLYDSIAEAERSRAQVPIPNIGSGIDPKDIFDSAAPLTPPSTPPNPSLIPRLRRMASFNSKRDTLLSPPRPQENSSSGNEFSGGSFEWGSPAPKKTRRSHSPGPSKMKVAIADIEITVTPPSAQPGTVTFPTESTRTPIRKRCVYDTAYLSPTYSPRNSLSGPSSPVRKHRKKNVH